MAVRSRVRAIADSVSDGPPGATKRPSRGLRVAPEEIRFEFFRAAGPGGQNVNKVSTAVRLFFDVRRSTSLPDEVKERLARLAGRRMTDDGVLVLEARRHRTQERNRAEALQRLQDLLARAWVRPRPRRPTRPRAAASEKRLEAKRLRSLTKRQRVRMHGAE